MRSVEGKEEVYPSRTWEAKLELVSLHSGENLASASIRPASQRLQNHWEGTRQSDQRPNDGFRSPPRPLLLKKTVVRLQYVFSGSERDEDRVIGDVSTRRPHGLCGLSRPLSRVGRWHANPPSLSLARVFVAVGSRG
jgi:hypothetical protein